MEPLLVVRPPASKDVNPRKHLDAVRQSTSPYGLRSGSPPAQLALRAQNLKVVDGSGSPLAPTLANHNFDGRPPPASRLRPPPVKARESLESMLQKPRQSADDMELQPEPPKERRQRRASVDALGGGTVVMFQGKSEVSRAARMEAASLRGIEPSPVAPPPKEWKEGSPAAAELAKASESWAADQRISPALLQYSRRTRRNSKDLSEGAHALAMARANAAAAKAKEAAQAADSAAAAAPKASSAPGAESDGGAAVGEGASSSSPLKRKRVFGFEAALQAKMAEAAAAKIKEDATSKTAPPLRAGSATAAGSGAMAPKALWLRAGQLMRHQIAMRASEGQRFRDTIKAVKKGVGAVREAVGIENVIAGWAEAPRVGELLDAADEAVCEQLAAIGVQSSRRRSLALPPMDASGADAAQLADRVRVNARMHLFSLRQNLELLERGYAEKAVAEASADEWAKMRSFDALERGEAKLEAAAAALKKRRNGVLPEGL